MILIVVDRSTTRRSYALLERGKKIDGASIDFVRWASTRSMAGLPRRLRMFVAFDLEEQFYGR